VLAATAGPRVCVVLPVPPGLRVSRERRAQRAALVLAASRASRDLRVTQVLVAQSGLAAAAQPGLRVPKVFKVPRESVASLGPVLAVLPDLWAPRESVVRWASKVPRVILAHLVLRVSLAATASRVTRVPLAPWAALGFVAPRVIAA